MAKKKMVIQWCAEPEAHNYPAAESYLSLMFETRVAQAYVAKLRQAGISEFKAKDIFRASGLSLLGINNSHVVRDQKKLKSNEPISPIRLVRSSALGRVVVANGYHRLCAIYSYAEDAIIRCKIV